MPNNEYLDSLSARQQKALDKLEELLAKPDGTIKWRLHVGRLVDRLVPRGVSEEYGRGCMTDLVEHLGRQKQFQAELYAARQVAACYPNLDVAKLQGRRGFHLRWCHLRWLAAVDDPKRRKELQRECLKERWSCSRLSREIQKEFGTRGRGGCRIKKPEEFGSAVSLREMIRLANRWTVCQPVWLDGARVRETAKASAAMQRDLETALEKLKQLEKLVPIARKAIQNHLAGLKARPDRQRKSSKRGRAK